MKADDYYGDRSDRHWGIMLMSEAVLHEAHPWTAALDYNETMKKGEFTETKVPDESVVSSLLIVVLHCVVFLRSGGLDRSFILAATY